jgi:3-hydroxyacyl-CoA dehydrogenase
MGSDAVREIRRAAVLGAGVMGAQIAAHLVNAGVPVWLFDLPAPDGDRTGIARRAIDGLAKLDPAPLATPALAAHIGAANYDEHLDRLAECDLVIEAIAERLDWKRELFARIAPHLAPHAILASNTSGLSISALAAGLPDALQPRFCGIHFFNPPRYMHLVELIPAPSSAPAMLDALETFLTTALGKGVIRAKDTPNFIANRIGVFSILAAFHHAQALGLGFDEIDALTGTRLGRPKSATFRTADLVGLDTLAHVIRTMQSGFPTIRGMRTSAHPTGCAGSSRTVRSARRRAAASTARTARRSPCSIPPRAAIVPPTATSIPRSPRC